MNRKVVVITLNYNRNDYTIDCVKSILKNTYDNFEILLIDNGSETNNYDILKSKFDKAEKINMIRLENNIGYVGGINKGLEIAYKTNAEYVLIMNNDTILDKNAIQSLLETCEKYNKKAIVSGKVYHYDEQDYLQYIGQDFDKEGMLNQVSIIKNRYEKDVGQYEKEEERGMLDDIFWMMPMDLYKNIGGYSEYYFLYGEQNDYAFTAIKNGYKLIYTPKAKIWHKGGATTCDTDKKSPKIQYWITMGTLKLSVLQLDSEKSSKFYKKWVIRETLKNLLLFILRKKNLSHLKAHFLALKHFHHWNEIRYKDNGYNPFNK